MSIVREAAHSKKPEGMVKCNFLQRWGSCMQMIYLSLPPILPAVPSYPCTV